ncbi:MAG: transposase [Patescibacteria group bacterium]
MQRADPFVVDEYYHIYNRGIDKKVIFQTERDHQRFVALLYISNTKESFRLDNIINQQKKRLNEVFQIDRGDTLVDIGAWCLMPNHFHILIREKTEGGISKFMLKLSTAYSMYFNIKRKRTGALLCRPFKSILIKNDNYLRHLFGYIHLNPIDLKFKDWKEKIKRDKKETNEMKIFLNSYKYSSYLDYFREERIENKILSTKKFPEYFLGVHEFMDFIEDYLSTEEE